LPFLFFFCILFGFEEEEQTKHEARKKNITVKHTHFVVGTKNSRKGLHKHKII